MEKNRKISIITPVFNGEKYIVRCIESVLNQTYNNIEHIVIDDGSTDKTSNICSSYKDKIVFIHKDNEGVSKARNIGIDKATGDYILFADADDWLEKDMCQKMIDEIESSDSEIVICGYNNYYENENKFEPIELKKYSDFNFIELITNDKTKYGGFPWNKLIKRKIIKNYFDESVHYYENLLFFLQNCNVNTKFSVIKDKLYNYCINDTSAVHTRKYSLKKVTALNSLNKIIPLLPQSTLIEHKVHYINNYFNNLYFLEDEMPNKVKELMPYKKEMGEYYKEVMKNKQVSLKTKVKLVCMYRFNFIYYIYKKKKERKKNGKSK